MGDPTSRITKFTREHDLINGSLYRDRGLFPARDAPGLAFLRFLSRLEKIFGALLVDGIEDRASENKQDHQDDVALHQRGRE